MCGRFDVDLSNREIDRMIGELPPGSMVRGGEVFPSNIALTLILANGVPRPEAMVWGFPRWKGKGVIFNARAESALQKPLFKKALLLHPAAIPATAFFEWRESALLGKKEKFRFFAPDGDILYLAGFWNRFPEEENPDRFTILTTSANPGMAKYHARMPVLVQKDEIEPWLTGAIREEVLSRQPFDLAAEDVSA